MSHRVSGTARRLVLWTAFAVGLAVSIATTPSPVRMAVAAQAAPQAAEAGPEGKSGSETTPGQADATGKTTKRDKEAASKKATGAGNAEVTIEPRGIIIDHGDEHVRIGGVDREYDSFEQFAKGAPWLAGLVFFVVSLVFLVPLLIIVLLIWYKVRKNRMLNETMIKLAEKGVVPPAQAMEALNASRVEPAVTAGPTTAPMYEQAKMMRRRAAWSDLRKGVLLIAVGFGLTAYSMFDDGSPNGLGLILLFVGVGFCVLWFFEERDPAQRPAAPPPPPPSGMPPGGA
jgi:4-amino-4-deoxy-L-arabinose transferase-like glycosyltransferase